MIENLFIFKVFKYINKTLEKNTVELAYLVNPKGYNQKHNVC